MWRADNPDSYDEQRTATEAAFLTAYANFANWLRKQIRSGDAELAFAVIERQRPTLSHLLGAALDTAAWDQAGAIARPLNDYWDAKGFSVEARGWVDRARLQLETPDGTPPSFDQPAGGLWLFLVGAEANRQQGAGLLNEAAATYESIRDALLAQPPSRRRDTDLGAAYHQLGSISQDRGLLNEAGAWYRKSLTLNEGLSDRLGMASSHHQLGMVAEFREQWDEAQAWYRKSLRIFEELSDRPMMAINCHQLGVLAQKRGSLDEAQGWYRKALTIDKELGNLPGIASSYHQLGMVAQWRGLLNDAQNWYRECLTIREGLGDRLGMVSSFGQMGLLAEARGDVREALEWIVRSVSMFEQFPHPLTGPAPWHLARLTGELGVDALRSCWREATGRDVPPEVLAYVETNLRSKQKGQ
jgi:tetratricopeptide (TPR) repeat protein